MLHIKEQNGHMRLGTEEAHVEYVQRTLADGLDVMAYGHVIWTSAVRAGYTQLVSVLLKARYPIHRAFQSTTHPSHAYTAIHLACQCANIPMVSLLLDHGANVYQCDSQDRFPIMYAMLGQTSKIASLDTAISEVSMLALVKLLVARGFDVNRASPLRHQTALHIACENDRETIVRFLLKQGANVNAVDMYGGNALYYMCQLVMPSVAILAHLVNHHIDLNCRDITKVNPFQLLVYNVKKCKRNLPFILYLMQQGPTPDWAYPRPYFVDVYLTNYPAMRTLLLLAVAKRREGSSWIKLLPTDLLYFLRSFLCIPNNYSFEDGTAFEMINL